MYESRGYDLDMTGYDCMYNSIYESRGYELIMDLVCMNLEDMSL